MSTQPPFRFENYPPEEEAMPADLSTPYQAVVRPVVPVSTPAAAADAARSRRTVIGLVIGIPVAGIVLSILAAGAGSLRDSGDQRGNPDGTDDNGGQISLGDHFAVVPSGWTAYDMSSGEVARVTNGSNRLVAQSVELGASALAVEEIARLAKGNYDGFSGDPGDPVDRSTASLQHATMDGVGTYDGKSARLMSELWIDDTGSGLLIVRTITARVGSVVTREAQQMVDDLSSGF